MSQKKDKKMRRWLRKEYNDLLEFEVGKNKEFIKPKPRWFPLFLWMFILKRFVYIKKVKQ